MPEGYGRGSPPCKWAEDAGADAIHVSAGTWDSRLKNYMDVMAGELSPEGKDLSLGVSISMWVPPNYTPRGSMIPFAAAVKKHVTVPVIAVCSITPEMAESALEKSEADFVSMGRQIIADPDYPSKVTAGKPEAIRRCLRCNVCLGEVMESRGISCAVNPEAGKEYESFVKITPASRKKWRWWGRARRAAATLTAAERGHDVTLFEKRLGGALHHVGTLISRWTIVIHRLHHRGCKNCGARIKTGIDADADSLVKEGYDTIIVATGASTYKPAIDGADDKASWILLKCWKVRSEGKDYRLRCGTGGLRGGDVSGGEGRT